MQVTTGLLSLLVLVPFVVANPMQISVEEFESLSMNHPGKPMPGLDRVFSIDCSGQTMQCTARVVSHGNGRPWLASWPLRSLRPIGHQVDGEEMEMMEALGPIVLNSIKCDGARYRCMGFLGKTALVAQWNAKVSRLGDENIMSESNDDDDESLDDGDFRPVPIKALGCERSRKRCVANLSISRGGDVAQWPIAAIL